MLVRETGNMKDTAKVIQAFNIKGSEAKKLEVEVYYNIGGMNYFTGHGMERGLYVSVTPVERSPGSYSYTAFSGTCKFIKPMKKFSKKALLECEPDPAVVQLLLANVLKKNNLELA